jgi:hemoglobin/transferrin/lactoferrin receptor protein
MWKSFCIQIQLNSSLIMAKFSIVLFWGVIITTQSLSAALPADSILNKEIQGVTVVGELSKAFALPTVVVDRNTIESSSYFTPADALRRETGISLVRDAIWATSLNVRGLSEQRLLVMTDGDRIQTATDHAAALSAVDLSSLEKIEVIKGAGSVLYGTGAMGGVVNFVSEQSIYTPTFQTKGKLGTEFNTVNNLWANSANIQFSAYNWYLSLNGSFRTAQDIKTPGGTLPNSQFHDASWSLKAGILYSPNQEVLVNYQHVKGWDIGLPGGRSFPATAVARYTGVERNQLSGEYVLKNINPDLKEVRFKVYTQSIIRDVELKPADPTVTIFPGSNNITSGAKLTSDWHFTDYHRLTLGAEGWQRNALTSRLTIKNKSDSTLIGTGDQPTPKARMLDLGAFAHYSWKIVPAKWSLDVGLRLDYIRTANDSAFSPLYQYTNHTNVSSMYQYESTESPGYYVKNLPRRVIFASSVHEDIAYAAHVDLVYNPTAQQRLALSLSNSYRVASIEERFKLIELAGPKHVGNPNLKPEKGTFSNLNYTFMNNKFRLKADVFANYLTDLITEKLGVYAYKNANGVAVSEQAYVNVNVSKALFLGAELEGKWQITNQFSALANASYTHARDIDADAYLPQIPPMSGFASLDYQSKEQVGASLSAMWTARQNETAAGETATAGHIVYNFDIHSGSIDLNNTWLKLFAGVENILNTSYLDHLSSTRGVLKLEPGRNIYLKMKWGW